MPKGKLKLTCLSGKHCSGLELIPTVLVSLSFLISSCTELYYIYSTGNMNQPNCTIPTLHQWKVTSPATLLPKSDILFMTLGFLLNQALDQSSRWALFRPSWSQRLHPFCRYLQVLYVLPKKFKKQTNKTHKHTQNKELT